MKIVESFPRRGVVKRPTRLLKVGDRIRLKVRALSGWKGLGTVTRDQIPGSGLVSFRGDGHMDESVAGREEVAAMRVPGAATEAARC